jgi:hypothetical protein
LSGLDVRTRQEHVQLGGDDEAGAAIVGPRLTCASTIDLPIATFFSAATRFSALWKHAA